jgi:5-methylcytosine-specific restriction enzyme B
MEKFINQQSNQGNGAPMAVNFLNIAKTKAVSDISVKENLHLFFKELKKSGAEFGYRSASEINRLIAILDALTKDSKKWDGLDINTEEEFIDIAIMQKLLPKLHGSRNKLTKVLPVLGGLCLSDAKNIKEKYFDKLDPIDYAADENIKYKISFEKICRMNKNAIENGFASYAEA